MEFEILGSDKNSETKITDLRMFVASTRFLEVLIEPTEFLMELIPFVHKVFQEYPPDSTLQFGKVNETRVFLIRLLSKFDYTDVTSEDIIPLLYDLLAHENIFNRYLTLRILFPVLDAKLEIDVPTHLEMVGSFFSNELPSAETVDLSRCELGFFAAAEAMNYLTKFQEKYCADLSLYTDIFTNICRALRAYFGPSGYIDKYRQNKKIICEYSSFGIRLLEFVNCLMISGPHIILNFLPEICYSIANLSPHDCYYLRRDVLKAIASTFYARRDLPYSIEKYFVKCSFNMVDYDPLKIMVMFHLCDFLVIFSKGVPKSVYMEFENRISEYVPREKNLALLLACTSAYTVNLNFLQKSVSDSIEAKFMIMNQLKNAERIFKLIHKEDSRAPSEFKDFESKPASMIECVEKLLEYIKNILKAIGTLRMHSRALESGDILILCEFLTFPLNFDIANLREYYLLFFELAVDDLELIIFSCAKDLLTKYHGKMYLWDVFLEKLNINFILIREANRLLHDDFVHQQFKDFRFYEKLLPLAYGFFKLDKKHFKNDATELFGVIFDGILNYRLREATSYARGTTYSLRENFSLLNRMFLDVKGCEHSAYTGLYFIYNHFEKTVRELYTVYCLTNDMIFIEYLFNIPISLNLLVTKYQILLMPMAVGLRCNAKLRDIVLKYIEYIIEFDNEEGSMDELLQSVYRILRDNGLKGMNILSRISNHHKEALSGGKIQEPRIPGSPSLSSDCVCNRYTDEGIETMRLSVGIDDVMRSQIKNLIGQEYIYGFVDLGGNSYENRVSRTPRFVETDAASRNTARGYLINYLIEILDLRRQNIYNFKEMAFKAAGPERAYDGQFSSCTFDFAVADGRGFDYYLRSKHTSSDIFLALFIDDSAESLQFLKACMRMHVLDECKTRRSPRSIELVYRCLYNANALCEYEEDLSTEGDSEEMDTLCKHVCDSDDEKGKRRCEYRRINLAEYLAETFFSIFADAYIYAERRTEEVVSHFYDLVDELEMPYAYKTEFALSQIAQLVECAYAKDDLKSLRAIQGIKFYLCNSTFSIRSELARDIFHCIRHKLKSPASRVYDLCLDICVLVLRAFGMNARYYFEKIFEIYANEPKLPYIKALYNEVEYMFGLNPGSDIMPEVDKRCLARILGHSRSVLARYVNLTAATEFFLKNIEKKDTSVVYPYIDLLNKMSDDKLLTLELLAAAKKYYPTVAVLEGFKSLEAKAKFVDNINRNGNLQNHNSNSFKVLRNLFHGCRLSSAIKSNFMSLYGTQNQEYKETVFDIILYCQDYDIQSLEFVFARMHEVIHCYEADSIHGFGHACVEVFKAIRARVFCLDVATREKFIKFLVERMDKYFVYYFVDLCISEIPENTKYFMTYLGEYAAKMTSGMSNPLECIALSRVACNIFKYLKSRGLKYSNNTTLLIFYKILHDSNNLDSECDIIVNWYFKRFSADDIECLYRINPSFIITSESLFLKIGEVETFHVKLWMLSCARRMLRNATKIEASNIRFTLTGAGPCAMMQPTGMYEPIRTGTKGAKEPVVFLRSHVKFESDSDTFSQPLVFEGRLNEWICTLNADEAKPSEDSTGTDSHGLAECDAECDERYAELLRGYIERRGVHAPGNAVRPSSQELAVCEDRYLRTDYSGVLQAVWNQDADDQDGLGILRDIDFSFLLKCHSDTIHPLIELFADIDYYCVEFISICKASIANASLRHVSLYYLCRFEPQIEYFEGIFKLNFQERKYAIASLEFLIDRFGYEPFIETIKTVIRSEMRFRSIIHVLMPLMLSRRQILENHEILFELSVMAHRLFVKREINYDLLEVVQLSNICPRLVTKLNTLVLLHEMESGKYRIFDSCNDFDLEEIIESKNIEKIFALLTRCISLKRSICEEEDLLKRDIVMMLKANPQVDISREVAEWLEISLSDLSQCSLNNQALALELFLEGNSTFAVEGLSSSETILPIMNNLVKMNYPNGERFSLILAKIINIGVDGLGKWMLSIVEDDVYVYPPVLEFIPDIIHKEDLEAVLTLCARRPLNITEDQISINILHLARKYPHALESYKKEFMAGLCSKTEHIRWNFLSIFANNVPKDTFQAIEFAMLFDYTGMDDAMIEYIVSVCIFLSMRFEGFGSMHCVPKPAAADADCWMNGLSAEMPMAIEDGQSASLLVDYARSARASLSQFSLLGFNISEEFFNLLFFSVDKPAIIFEALSAVFGILHSRNVSHLYRLYCSRFRGLSYRIRLPFIKAFDARGVCTEDLYYSSRKPSLRYYCTIEDNPMYYGMLKAGKGIREMKTIAKLRMFDQPDLASVKIYDVIKGVQDRAISYRLEDMRVLECELCSFAGGFFPPANRVYDLSEDIDRPLRDALTSGFNYDHDIDMVGKSLFAIINQVSKPDTGNSMLLGGMMAEEIKKLISSLSIVFYIPRSSRAFQKLLLYASIAYEINESFIILNENMSDSIYGRFRMWMIRHPSYYASMDDWLLFIKWRHFAFSKALAIVPEADKKKINSEICKLNCIYASKAFKERLYQKCSCILSEISAVNSVEVSQNLVKYLMDIECLFERGEYSTTVSLINSININRFGNEDKSRLYHWAAKAFKKMNKTAEVEKFSLLSRRIADILENKKEDLEIARSVYRDSAIMQQSMPLDDNAGIIQHNAHRHSDQEGAPAHLAQPGRRGKRNVYGIYTTKLVDLINELSIQESRIYVMEAIDLKDRALIGQIQTQKLYFFLPQLDNSEEIIDNNPMIKASFRTANVFHELSFREDSRASSYHKLKQEFCLVVRNCVERIKSHNDCRKDGHIAESESLSSTCSYAENSNIFKILENVELPTDPLGLLREITEKMFFTELKLTFEYALHNTIMHSFENDVALPSQYSVLRNEYDNILMMSYIEGFHSAFDSAENIFHVRIANGSLVKIHVHSNDSYHRSLGRKVGIDDVVQFNVNIQQTLQLINETVANHQLDKLGFKICGLPTFIVADSRRYIDSPDSADEGLQKEATEPEATCKSNAGLTDFSEKDAESTEDTVHLSFASNIQHDEIMDYRRNCVETSRPSGSLATIHFGPDCSVDHHIKMQLLRKRRRLSSVLIDHIRRLIGDENPSASFNQSIMEYQALLKTEAVERLVDANNFYLYKRAFINSYSSIICAQQMLSICDISLGDTLIDKTTGESSVGFFSGYHSKKFYLRPNLGYLMGNEGKNGPLVVILGRFAESVLKGDTLKVLRFFFNDEKAIEVEKRISKLVYNGADETSNSQEIHISEMTDPKLGMTLDDNLMPWI